jgi:hypothetical protein
MSFSHLKFLVAFCLLLLCNYSFSQKNIFKNIDCDSIVAYEYEGTGNVLIQDAVKSKNELITKSKQVDSKFAKNLGSIITDSKAYGQTTAFCFDPHLGILFWKDGNIVESISICLECNFLKSSKSIPATSIKQIQISDDYSYPAKGFSRKTRVKIDNLCRELGFVKFLKPLESIFDMKQPED